jgi:hypothetical protein
MFSFSIVWPRVNVNEPAAIDGQGAFLHSGLMYSDVALWTLLLCLAEAQAVYCSKGREHMQYA